MQLIKRESFVEICYDDKMVPIDDINIEDIGGWRIKINLDFNKTILAINVTNTWESENVQLYLIYNIVKSFNHLNHHHLFLQIYHLHHIYLLFHLLNV